MQNKDYAKEKKERALEYIGAVIRMMRRVKSRFRFRHSLQAMAEGDVPNALRSVWRQWDGSVSPVSQESSPVSLREEVQARLAELDREQAKEMVRLQAALEQTWELFSWLSHPKAGLILEEFYLNGVPIRFIAAETAFDERYIYQVKDQALRELGELLTDKGIEDPS